MGFFHICLPLNVTPAPKQNESDKYLQLLWPTAISVRSCEHSTLASYSIRITKLLHNENITQENILLLYTSYIMVLISLK